MKAIATVVLLVSLGFMLLNVSCRKPTEPCANVICYNGGKCIDGKCKCAEGWTGPDCSERIKRP